MTTLQELHHLDKDITLALNSLHCPFSDTVWQIFSDKEIWFVLYAVIVFFFFRNLGWKKALVFIGAAVLCLVASDQASNLVKFSVQRLRPCHDLDMISGGLNILENPGGLYGFFSAHASNALSFAIVSIFAFSLDGRRKYGIYNVAIVIWALLVGISRVFVGKHFLGDVLVGFAVGIIFALIFGFLGRWVCGKIR